MTDKVRLKKAIGGALTSKGFHKKGQSWYLHGEDSIVVINLQKDDFSELYYVNFGIWLLALGDAHYPPENRCHINARLEELFPTSRVLIHDACTVKPGDAELSEFIDLIVASVIPLCQRCLTLSGLKEEAKHGNIPQYFVIRTARPLLGLPERT